MTILTDFDASLSFFRPYLLGLGKEEQKKLRTEYVATIRMNLRAQLDNISVQEEDGSITNLGEKYGLKKGN